MPLARDVYEKYIIEKLALLQSMVTLSNSQQLYDIDHTLEDFCVGLLNIVFGWNLKNINYEKKNTPAIDLGDEGEGVAIQITSDKTGEKIKDTINKFLEKNLDKKYSRLIVVLLVQKQNSYSFSYDTKGRISFSLQNDILDFSDLLTIIKKNDKLHETYEYVQAEFPDIYKKVDFEMLDRVKSIVKSLETGCERDAALDIELLFGEQVNEVYSHLLELLSLQADRLEFLDFYDEQLRSILSEEGLEEEYEMMLAQAEQYDYYEPLYEFCSHYRFETRIPYDYTRSEVIDFRSEQEAVFQRAKEIENARKKCIELIKAKAKQMV